MQRQLHGTSKQIEVAQKIIKEMAGKVLNPRASFEKYEKIQSKLETEKFDTFAQSYLDDFTKEELMYIQHMGKHTEGYFIYNYVDDAAAIIEYHKNMTYYGKKHYYDVNGTRQHKYL